MAQSFDIHALLWVFIGDGTVFGSLVSYAVFCFFRLLNEQSLNPVDLFDELPHQDIDEYTFFVRLGVTVIGFWGIVGNLVYGLLPSPLYSYRGDGDWVWHYLFPTSLWENRLGYPLYLIAKVSLATWLINRASESWQEYYRNRGGMKKETYQH